MKKLIVANWKMYPKSLKEAREKFVAIRKVGATLRNVQTVVCAPAPFIGDLKKLVTGHRVVLGGQNLWTEPEGACTGEISGGQLASVGAEYVVVGHSERRALGENDELVNKKVLAALKASLVVVLCVGEETRDSDGAYLRFIESQIREDLRGVAKKDLARIAVAYEPVWAIGSRALRAATPEDALEVSIFIKRALLDMFGKASEAVPVLYGGSVDAKNAKAFLSDARMQGLLVGRASLDAKIFATILKNADVV